MSSESRASQIEGVRVTRPAGAQSTLSSKFAMITGLLPGLMSFGCLIAVWWVVAITGLVDIKLMPSPGTIFHRFLTMLTERQLWLDALVSTGRVMSGVILGLLFAIPVSFLLGWYRSFSAFIQPVINFFRSLPPIALIPLVIVYFGIGETARISVLVYSAFFSGVIVIYEGIRLMPPIYVQVARALGAGEFEIFRRVVLPASLPHVLTAFRVATGVCWMTVVAAELVAGERGLGAVIVSGQNFFQVPEIFVGIISIGTIALVMDRMLALIAGRLLKWQDRLQ